MYEITCLDKNGKSVTHLTQWDINQSLLIKGLGVKSSPEFHFCNKNSDEALVVSSSLDTLNDVLTVKIPNKLLEEPYPIFVYVYYYSESNSAKTIAEIKLPIRQRVKPSDYEYVENIDYVTAESIKVDILNNINNLTLKSTEVEDNYKISLYNLNGLEITSCELPISDAVEKITSQLNNFTLTSEKLDSNDYRITLYNSDNIKVSHCDIMTSEIIEYIETKNAEITSKHDEDIQEIENTIIEINEKVAEINQVPSLYDYLTKYTSNLHPEYSLYTTSFIHYTGDFYGTSVSFNKVNYNPDNNDSLMVWVDGELLIPHTDYSLNEAGESLYVVVFAEELPAGSKIIIQIWNKPRYAASEETTTYDLSGMSSILFTGTNRNRVGTATIIEETEEG